jgi:hypothetical protein
VCQSRGLPSDQAELLAVVKSDLAFLEDEWDESIDEHSLRRSSTVLRRLLVLGDYAKVWRIAGEPKEPQLEAVDLSNSLAGLELARVFFATAGGGRSGGGEISGALQYSGVMSAELIQERYERGGPPRRVYRLSEFLASPGVVFQGEHVSRRHVIKYVANKLGGDHFDPARRKDEQAYKILDDAMNAAQVLDQRLVYFELLSIGQAVAQSADAKKLRGLIT